MLVLFFFFICEPKKKKSTQKRRKDAIVFNVFASLSRILRIALPIKETAKQSGRIKH